MAESSVTLNSFSVSASQIPAAPTYSSVTQPGSPPGALTVIVTVPTVDTFAVPLASGNEVKKVTLAYSENAFPDGYTMVQILAMPANEVFRASINMSPPVPGTVTFNLTGLALGQPIYLAIAADN